VLTGVVIVTGTDAELVEIGMLVAGITLLWEESAWAAGASMRTVTSPHLTVRLCPVWLTHTSSISILLSVFDALLTVIVGWSSTVFTVDVAWAVVLRAVRAIPVSIASTDAIGESGVLLTGSTVVKLWASTLATVEVALTEVDRAVRVAESVISSCPVVLTDTGAVLITLGVSSTGNAALWAL
jgi:hypothetical protein